MPTPNRTSATRHALERLRLWVTKAAPGSIFTYHTGLLLEDRWETTYMTATQDEEGFTLYERQVQPCEPIHSVALEVERLANDNMVLLFQRRRGPCEYDYLAVRTSKGA